MFNSVYPALEELKQPLSQDQLNILKNQLDSEQPKPTSQTQFNYAWGLIKSNQHRLQQQGIDILVKLYKQESEMRREILYYLSLGSFKIGDFSNAKRYIDSLLKIEPENQQALQLKDNIDDKITKEGLIGIGIAGGVLALGVGIIGALVRKNRK
ncbi:FIS1 [Candida pseudojiufengensis]|uniref:FIS1 n=1 Tax=Candida pseudojiufengensis TaxID=497109 RepID=UPI002224B1F4|nr:FIS1 [Candida pseudojiufengensis]KAI5960848.1 FIS1 [Candida pseudojiufengensis]